MSLFKPDYLIVNTHTRHTHEHKTIVEEKRAPTAESARLLRDLEREALKRVVDVVQIDNNELAVQLQLEEDPAKVRVILDLNGKRHSWVFPIDFSKKADQNTSFLITAIRDNLASRIVDDVLEKTTQGIHDAVDQFCRFKGA